MEGANGGAGGAFGEQQVTLAVVISCIVAGSGGLIFGYDIGISGGVTTMEPFLRKFFPSVLKKSGDAKTNMYCMYDSHLLTFFTSSLYIAGFFASLLASRITAKFGRKFTMVLGGCTFLFGGALNGAAQNITMLFIGRIFLGFGVGFTNQATPLYLSEMAPPKWRGAFNSGFQFFIGLGVVVASCINFAVAKYPWGWRLSLGFAVVPAIIMTTGLYIIPDTPNSLLERGKTEEAENALRRARGDNADVSAELSQLKAATQLAIVANEEPFLTIFEKHHRPHLVLAVLIPFFQQLTGINVIAFYGPVLFQSVGFGSDSALIAAIILGSVNLCSIVMSAFMVDRFGRRFLFIEGGLQMFFSEIAIAGILAVTTGVTRTGNMSKGIAILVLVLMCNYAAAFGWSWGPLSWLLPSEIFPLNIRPTGQSISVAISFAVTFVLSQTFLAMLCCFKFGTFIFYAGCICVMTIFVVLLVPETKGIPLDSMQVVWKQHWYWRRFAKEEEP